jgi:AmmeMemoRadiSam system protein A
MTPPQNGAAHRGRVLLTIARESLLEAFGRALAGAHPEPWLDEPGATFVTLRLSGSLRGCVGSIRAYRPLRDDVRSNARAAAFSDTRFPPLGRGELDAVGLEISLLSEPEPLPVDSEKELCCTLRPGVDGVILECGDCRGTFLPQVWEQLPEPGDFLAHLRHKAGLPPGFWEDGLRVWRYTVTKWEEAEK